ncbi:MAG: glycosyltransferase [Acidiferrobacteraceae bacterium]
MRIVLVISDLRVGGAETQVIGLARALRQRGHAVAVYTLNRNNPRAAELDGLGIQLVADQKRMKLDPAVILRLRRFVRKFRADIVHGFLYDGDLYTRIAVVGTGIPVLNSERNDNYRLKPQQWLGLWLTRHLADGVVANSHAGARFARNLFRLPAEHTHVVWNGIDLAEIKRRCAASIVDYRREFFSRTDIKLATLVGQIKPQKDYLLALQVADILTRAHDGWRVLFVGDQLSTTAAYRAEVMQNFQDLGLERRALFVGMRPDAVEIMHQSSVLFSTSRHEGFPNVVLEAMVTNVPVVSTAYSDIQMILPEPWQVTATRDPAMIAEAILRADSERSRIAERQHTWVEQHATLDAAANRLEAVYHRYVGSRSTSRGISSGRAGI